MKRIIQAAALLIVLAVILPTGHALAERPVQVFFAKGALSREAAQQLMELTGRTFPQAKWTALWEEETGEDLRTLVLSDRTPDLAVCAPGEAMPWARENMLVPLEAFTSGWTDMQQQVTDACTWRDHLVLSPLRAEHRSMAVNRKLLERIDMGYLTGRRDHPVWYPSEFSQLLEEFSLQGRPALEIWPAEPESCAAMEAMIQALFGGFLLSEDGRTAKVDNPGVKSALSWLGECVENDLIGRAESREAALENFLKGKTAVFLDWTPQEQHRQVQAVKHGGMELEAVPYPSICGLPVRSFELTGACVFAGDRQALAVKAVQLWNSAPQAQSILGERAVWRDGAIWLPVMQAGGVGTTVRSLICAAMEDVISGKTTADEAVTVIGAALRAMERN